MENNLARPIGNRVIIKRLEATETVQNGLIIPDVAVEKPQEGEVIAVGNGKRLESGTLVPVDVEVGDRILFGKYSGVEIKIGVGNYLILGEDEILAVLPNAGRP